MKTDDPEKSTAKKKAAFLRDFGKYGSIARSARIAGIDRTTHYEWLVRDAKYKAKFELKVLMASDAERDALARLVREGFFTPLIYKGQFCYAARTRIICQLADGTSAFQDELPKGAQVTGTRKVTTHDGEMLGRTRHSASAHLKLMAILNPERWGHVVRRERKPPAR